MSPDKTCSINIDTIDAAKVLGGVKTIAVVGLSPDPGRPSHRVAAYLKSAGYRIIPIRPMIKEVLGEKAYASLNDVPKEIHIDMIDIFRKSEDVPPIVKSAIARGDVRVVWMQEGITNEEAKREAEGKGMVVVMDRCALKEHKKMMEG